MVKWVINPHLGVLNLGSMDGLQKFWKPFDLYPYCGGMGAFDGEGGREEGYTFLRFSKDVPYF